MRITSEYKPGYMRPSGQEGLDLKEYWLVLQDRCVGYLSIMAKLSPEQEYAPGHIGVWVDPRYQGKGFGKLLLTRGIREAEELGISPILLVTHEENWPSRNMMRACGAELTDHYAHKLGSLCRYKVN